MADNNVEQNPLPQPLQLGVDHSNFDKLPEVVGKEIGLPAQALAPTDKTAQDLAETNVADYLEKMGATVSATNLGALKPDSAVDDLKEAIGSIIPKINEAEDTTRYASDEEWKKVMETKNNDQPEEKAA